MSSIYTLNMKYRQQAKLKARRNRKGNFTNDCCWEIALNFLIFTSGVHTPVNTEKRKVFEIFSNKSFSKLESSVLRNMNKK